DIVIETKPLISFGIDFIQIVINKLNKWYDDKYTPYAKSDFSLYESMKKHEAQQISLCRVLRESNLLAKECVIFEYGSGKAKLSWSIAETMDLDVAKSSTFCLIDRDSSRHKADVKIRGLSKNIHRKKMDIKDFSATNWLKSQNLQNKNIIFVGKHICGAGMCLTIKSISNLIKDGINVETVLIAQCCHHRCNWEMFVGKEEFLAEGFEQNEFEVLKLLTSWKTCGARKGKEENVNSYGLTASERSDIGFKAKYLLNYIRRIYLSKLGFSRIDLLEYVPESTSLENVALFAVK
ncbi:DUF715-domain-containing protein, partial [Rozella allomycis CSF55]